MAAQEAGCGDDFVEGGGRGSGGAGAGKGFGRVLAFTHRTFSAKTRHPAHKGGTWVTREEFRQLARDAASVPAYPPLA